MWPTISIACSTLLIIVAFTVCARVLRRSLTNAKTKKIVRLLQYADDQRVRILAMEELAELDIEAGIPVLVDALRDGNLAVRAAAQRIVVNISEASASRLNELWPKNITQSFWANIVTNIQYLRLRRRLHNKVVPVLREVLEELDGELRQKGLEALTELQDVRLTDLAKADVISESVQLSAHYPRSIRPDSWTPLIAYIYKERARDIVSLDARGRLRNHANTVESTISSTVPVPGDTMITATVDIEGVQATPRYATFGLSRTWHRLEFQIKADDHMPERVRNGSVMFSVEGIIIGQVPISIRVEHDALDTGTRTETGKCYQAIFCSYSHEDVEIVKRVEFVCNTLGFKYLRDVISLRSGETWREELPKLIEQADIFQLFWSVAAAKSTNVEMEWRHALRQDRTDHFVRPVYWTEPMPPPPSELQHIHFCYEPRLRSFAEER